MSHSEPQDDKLFDIAKINSNTSDLVTTRETALCPARRSSPPLSDLFPEYYEPIEPERSSSPSEPLGTTEMSSEFEHAQPPRDGMLPEYLHSTRKELQARELKSHHELVCSSEGFDEDSSAVSSSVSPLTTRPTQSVKPGRPRPSAASKHHCLISGHLFEHYRLSQLPAGVEIDGLGPPSQQSMHKQEDLKIGTGEGEWCQSWMERKELEDFIPTNASQNGLQSLTIKHQRQNYLKWNGPEIKETPFT